MQVSYVMDLVQFVYAMHACMYLYTYMHVYVYMYVHKKLSRHCMGKVSVDNTCYENMTHICIYIYIYIHIYIYTHIYIYIYMHVLYVICLDLVVLFYYVTRHS